MNYKELIPFLTSPHYKDRVIGEYRELEQRYKGITRILNGELDEDTSAKYNLTLLTRQANAIMKYMEVLEDRAKVERINLKREKPWCLKGGVE